MSDQQNVSAAYHSNGLPARFALDFAVLNRDMERIVEDQNRRFEADAVFPLVGPVLAVIPGELPRGFRSGFRNDKCVYTLREVPRECKGDSGRTRARAPTGRSHFSQKRREVGHPPSSG